MTITQAEFLLRVYEKEREHYHNGYDAMETAVNLLNYAEKQFGVLID